MAKKIAFLVKEKKTGAAGNSEIGNVHFKQNLKDIDDSINAGPGDAGGQALSITYVDNYSMLTFMYTLILLLIDEENERQRAAADKVLPLLESIMEEQKMYRQYFFRNPSVFKIKLNRMVLKRGGIRTLALTIATAGIY
ncbi:hypothetical protein V7128_29780 [Neobacillus vireti]|uniref:hypothetical protein n=1 Tax=Neobacillus vireti TaxID=220686 RepID=UPI002FFF0B4E